MPARALDPVALAERRRAARALIRLARDAPPWERRTYLALADGVLRAAHPATARRLRRLAAGDGPAPDEEAGTAPALLARRAT
jgi:hypothetical protein